MTSESSLNELATTVTAIANENKKICKAIIQMRDVNRQPSIMQLLVLRLMRKRYAKGSRHYLPLFSILVFTYLCLCH